MTGATRSIDIPAENQHVLQRKIFGLSNVISNDTKRPTGLIAWKLFVMHVINYKGRFIVRFGAFNQKVQLDSPKTPRNKRQKSGRRRQDIHKSIMHKSEGSTP
eukprot:2800173-Karenia_brevis.AAC.1